MASRLQRALQVLFGSEEKSNNTQPTVQNQAPGVLSQEPGSLVTLEAEQVDVSIVGDNDQVKVQRSGRMMGGEEIRPGTLH